MSQLIAHPEAARGVQVHTTKLTEVMLADSLTAGLRGFQQCLAQSLGVVKGQTGSIGVGMRQLALMLARDELVLEEEDELVLQIPLPLRPRRPEFKYGQVLMAVSRMCESGIVDERSLVDGLRVSVGCAPPCACHALTAQGPPC